MFTLDLFRELQHLERLNVVMLLYDRLERSLMRGNFSPLIWKEFFQQLFLS